MSSSAGAIAGTSVCTMSAAWAGACGSAPLLDMVTGGRVDWSSMPANFDHFHYPGFDFAVPNDPAQYRQRLGERFPSERDAIATYFRDVRGAADWGLIRCYTKNLTRV